MIITLLTDFGTRDSYLGEVRGVLLSLSPGATLVDLTHEILPGDIAAGAYILDRCRRQFPAGTVHLAVVDPGVGTSRAALAVRAHGQFFVGPDNGLFTRIYRDAAVEAVVLRAAGGGSATFHGRDLFAPAAAALASGRPLQTLGVPLEAEPERLNIPEPSLVPGGVRGEVIYVDRFGTLVTNIGSALLPDDARVRVQDLDLGPLRRTFGEVPSGALLAFVGSDDSIEIAVRDGSAAERLGVGRGSAVWALARSDSRVP